MLSHRADVLLLGSCFTEHIARRLEELRFSVLTNPAGITYNPVSIGDQLSRLSEGRPYTEDDLREYEGLWFSPWHHGAFSERTREKTFAKIQLSYETASHFFLRASHIVITLGSSVVYKHDGEVWNNCHKLPGRLFLKEQLAVEDVVGAFDDVIRRRPDLRFIFTVSPVRYLHDNNSLNKATLLMAAFELARRHENVSYFPAYEIMMDELRDYRFYAEDMIHPSETAVKIIFERFGQTYFTDLTLRLNSEIEELNLRLSHRPLHPESPEYLKFKQKTDEYEKAISDALVRSRHAADDCPTARG